MVWNCQTPTSISSSSPAVVDGVLYVGSDYGVLYAFGTSTTPINTPTPTSTPTNITQATPTPSTDPTKTINLTLNGNISLSQISNLNVTTNPATNKTTISFSLTGQNGTVGFCNMTLPKNEIPNTTNPIIYIDNEPAQNQGYTQDSSNYYVWFTTHFSTHQISIEFTNEAHKDGVEGAINAVQILYGVAIAFVIAVAVLVVLKLTLSNKKTKAVSQLRVNKSLIAPCSWVE